MKAVAIFEHGGVEKLTLTDLPKPILDVDDVLINVKAVAMNHLDLWVRAGLPGLKLPLPHLLGSDVAGVIAEIGAEVRGLQIGQRVTINPGWWDTTCEYCRAEQECLCVNFKIFGEHLTGGYAEFMRVPARNVLPIPDALPFEQAAAAPLAFLTAWRALMTQARLQTGETVLITGIGGGVASAAIQIARYAGARVLVTSSSDAKLERAREFGAEVLINYTRQ
ncbi:MAG: alcohol dehydrogenase catalytic domain-containing protein [Chloroflexi bacterium]|nr:alcohol dehydrogenase catalytic domain-containing protein [Chloroflexota bacterium]